MGNDGSRPNSGRLLILGGGGHASVVADILKSVEYQELLSSAAVLDAGLFEGEKQTSFGLPVVGNDEFLQRAKTEGFARFVVAVGGGIDSQKRKALFDRAVEAGLSPLTLVHPLAVVSQSAKLGPGTTVMPKSVVNANSRVGANAIINTSAVVEHDCSIGDHVHVAPRACLLGGVAVEDLAFVGAGSVIRQGLKIGEGAVVGCGAVVVKDVPSGATVYGNPAI